MGRGTKRIKVVRVVQKSCEKSCEVGERCRVYSWKGEGEFSAHSVAYYMVGICTGLPAKK